MKIKTKLTLWVGLLFILIVVLALLGARQVNALRDDTKNILVANYNTLDYARNMLKALDAFIEDKDADAVFTQELEKQQHNISEIGEDEATQRLAAHYQEFKQNPTDAGLARLVRNDLNEILELNLDAIERKSAIAANTAENATFWIALTGTFCFLIAFTLLINLPGNIADPISELTESIKQIADQKYSQRVHFEGHNEFGELAVSFNTMAEKLEEYNSSNLAILMMEKKRIETLIENMHDPVIGLDEDMRVLFANEEAANICGLSKEKMIGKSAQELAVTNDLIRALIRDLVAPGSAPVHQQPIKIYADAKESYFEKEIVDISIIPTGEKIKRLIGHVIILRNVTVYKEIDFAKTNFIATVSHEFKTPISSIKMSVQLLENERIGTLNEEQKNLLDSIRDDAGRLLKITGELLNISQVESGNIQMAVIPTDVHEILDYALSANKLQAEQKQIRIQVHAPEPLPKVLADAEKTAWVLTNLISNAIRYSHEHAVVEITLRAEAENLSIAVRDTGQGIAPQYLDKIFDRYFRIPGTQKEGTGLGLAISKEFMEAQGGCIKVDSDFGAGSVFTMVLGRV
jgi:NtrC-family two-component system sensor histidine kinase KinB